MSDSIPNANHADHLDSIRDPGTLPAEFVVAMEALGRRSAARLCADLEPSVHAVHLVGRVEDHDGFTAGLASGLHDAGFTVSVGTYWLKMRPIPHDPELVDARKLLHHVTGEPEKPFALVLSSSVGGTPEAAEIIFSDAMALGPKSMHVATAISHEDFPDRVRETMKAEDACRTHFWTLATDPDLGSDLNPSPGIGGSIIDRSGIGSSPFIPASIRRTMETAEGATLAARVVAADGRTFPPIED